MKISFLGDISLNDSYNELYKKGLKPFHDISKTIKGSDYIIGNLESAVKGNEDGINPLKSPHLSTSLNTLNYLKDINIDMVCLANNHIYDYLEDGYNKTINFLDQNNIKYIGTQGLRSNVQELDGIKFCFLNYVANDTNPYFPKDCKINVFDKKQVIDDIKQYRKSVDQIIILLHWGGKTENGYYPDFKQSMNARTFIDNGADLIIGHHSHTFQPFECYKGKYIFYSLGNFCFSDIYQDNKLYCKLSKRQKQSIVLEVDFKKNKEYSMNMIPIKNIGCYIIKSDNSFQYTKFHIRNFVFKILKRSNILWKIYFFKLKKINPILNYLFIQRGSLKNALTYNKILKYLEINKY